MQTCFNALLIKLQLDVKVSCYYLVTNLIFFSFPEFSDPEYEYSQPTSTPDDKQLSKTLASSSSGGSGSRNYPFTLSNAELVSCSWST